MNGKGKELRNGNGLAGYERTDAARGFDAVAVDVGLEILIF